MLWTPSLEVYLASRSGSKCRAVDGHTVVTALSEGTSWALLPLSFTFWVTVIAYIIQ